MKQTFIAISLSILTFFFCNVAAGETKNYNIAIDPPVREIHEIISKQISAFRQNNAEEAYSFASPFIKSKFRSPSIFMAMVKGSYPMIWNPQKFKFMEQRSHASNIIQRVIFTDGDDNLFFFDYLMLKSDGSWAIHGVYQVQAGSIGT